MDSDQREALVEFLQVMLRYMLHHGGAAEQAEALETWQVLYERLLVDPR